VHGVPPDLADIVWIPAQSTFGVERPVFSIFPDALALCEKADVELDCAELRQEDISPADDDCTYPRETMEGWTRRQKLYHGY
jgi:hypothetical protein